MSRAMNLGYTQNPRSQQCQLIMCQAPRQVLLTGAPLQRVLKNTFRQEQHFSGFPKNMDPSQKGLNPACPHRRETLSLRLQIRLPVSTSRSTSNFFLSRRFVFLYSLIPEICIEHLLSVRHCSGPWGTQLWTQRTCLPLQHSLLPTGKTDCRQRKHAMLQAMRVLWRRTKQGRGWK